MIEHKGGSTLEIYETAYFLFFEYLRLRTCLEFEILHNHAENIREQEFRKKIP